jgi:hypothetical protein
VQGHGKTPPATNSPIPGFVFNRPISEPTAA